MKLRSQIDKQPFLFGRLHADDALILSEIEHLSEFLEPEFLPIEVRLLFLHPVR